MIKARTPVWAFYSHAYAVLACLGSNSPQLVAQGTLYVSRIPDTLLLAVG